MLRQQKNDNLRRQGTNYLDTNSDMTSEVQGYGIQSQQQSAESNFLSIDPKEEGERETVIEVSPASYRLIMVTVCLSQKITSNQEAYQNLINALINFHKNLQPEDYVCYNIGSPLLNSKLLTDV
mgnify:CR=1 FL=1